MRPTQNDTTFTITTSSKMTRARLLLTISSLLLRTAVGVPNSYSYLDAFSYSYDLDTCEYTGLYIEAQVWAGYLNLTYATAANYSTEFSNYYEPHVSTLTGFGAFLTGPLYLGASDSFYVMAVTVFGTEHGRAVANALENG